ncbi:hypothetical protein TNCV_4550721 [Trichonephila clavipes]|nr:hypothetical protein TNCV_4550721 [Trichonephila clavipes]
MRPDNIFIPDELLTQLPLIQIRVNAVAVCKLVEGVICSRDASSHPDTCKHVKGVRLVKSVKAQRVPMSVVGKFLVTSSDVEFFPYLKRRSSTDHGSSILVYSKGDQPK